jgi:hypothetical protein
MPDLPGRCSDELHHTFGSQLRGFLRPYLVVEVGPVERRYEYLRCAKVEGLRHDIALYLWCGSRSERYDREALPAAHLRSPLIRLYSGRKSWPHSDIQCASSTATKEIGTSLNISCGLLFGQRLRGYKQHFGLSLLDVLDDLDAFCATERGVEEVGYVVIGGVSFSPGLPDFSSVL